MKSPEEFQGEIKPSSVINANNYCKSIELESLLISSKKITDSKGNFHAKMGTIKDRNGTNITEAETIKKRWEE